VSRSVVLSKLINIQPFPFLEYGKKKKNNKKNSRNNNEINTKTEERKNNDKATHRKYKTKLFLLSQVILAVIVPRTDRKSNITIDLHTLN
jgi:hypothetical protein